MPLLFYGRLDGRKRRLYSKDLRQIETSVYDNWKIKHLSPEREGDDMRYIANFWWFMESKHTAVSWNEGRIDITQPVGIRDNEAEEVYEQTVFIPQLVSRLEALAILRSEFPDYLTPSAIVFRFNNQLEVYVYD